MVDIIKPSEDPVYQANIKNVGLLEDKRDTELEFSAYMYGASTFAQLANTKINYDVLQVNEMQRETQANLIETQAKEQANMIREQFVENVGNAQFGASRRGVKTTEGSIAKNIEESSADLGKDIKKLRKGAKSKAQTMRAQSKINKRLGRARVAGGLLSAVNLGTKSAELYGKAN